MGRLGGMTDTPEAPPPAAPQTQETGKKQKYYRPGMPKDAPLSQNAKNQRMFNLLMVVLVLSLISWFFFGTTPTPMGVPQLTTPEPLKDGKQLEAIRFKELAEGRSISIMGNLVPSFRDNVRVEVLRQGKGVPSLCGQTLTYRLMMGTEKGDAKAEEKTLRLGDLREPEGLSQGLVNMRVGEVRRLTIPE